MESLLTTIDKRGIATITLNKPKTHNAFDDKLLMELQQAIRAVEDNENVVVIVLRANGKSFSAGADLQWMKRVASYSEEENYQDAKRMSDFFQSLAMLPKPTIAVVQGAALGGGMGLVACCDIVIASEDAVFGLPEVKIGLVPAVISPYVRRAIGDRNLQRYSLTGERFGVEEALRLGLVHINAKRAELSETVENLCEQLLKNSPAAMASVKTKLSAHLDMQLPARSEYTAREIARIRVSAQGREGIAAFLEKRRPLWKMD